ncbi:transcriptional regulator [Periconia macrospinosa]|uniref:Transcriptional regulator n=1 Tax=Periconia macrospinosa TaxID=97972 RepID=A0A2V1EA49_9PLEO|nr:transcriptional regulator [Periconia macrospinosa]
MLSQIFVAALIYPAADWMDFSGPLEVYQSAGYNSTQRPFNLTTFSLHSPVSASSTGDLTFVPDLTFAEASEQLSSFDILIIPGANVDKIDGLLATDEGTKIKGMIKEFSQLPPRNETRRRILQSTCTGALILAASDVLRNRTATTHHWFYDQLTVYADKAAGGPSGINAVKKRWAYGGKTEGNVEIVTAGGVSSGIDTSLFITEMLLGKEVAEWASETMEFERRPEDAPWGSNN